jgi:hypothetical protein
MNLRQVSMAISCFLFSINLLSGQSSEYVKPQVINYNFENKLKFEWPSNYHAWTKDGYYKSILQTQKFTSTILNNIKEIQYESKSGDPLDINIFFNDQKTQMDIRKNLRPVTYQYKDSMLLFTGLHVMHLTSPDQHPIRIYFDDVNALNDLKDMSFIGIYDGISQDLNQRKILSKKDIRQSKEIMYEQNGDEMVQNGIIKENANYRYGLGVVLGGIIAPGDLGVTGMTDFSRIKYTLTNLGQTIIKSKTSLSLGYSFLGNNDITTIGASYMTTPLNPRFQEEIKLVGFGMGLINMSTLKGEQSRTGGYFSINLEKKHIFLSQSFNIPFEKNPLVDWSYLTLMAGYRF